MMPRGVGIRPRYFPVLSNDLHPGVGAHIQASLRIDRSAIANAARRGALRNLGGWSSMPGPLRQKRRA